MHENASIAKQSQQSSPAAALAMEVTPTQERQFDAETDLVDRFPVQLKLTVGAPNDPLEHEADATADKVMRMPATPLVQRKSSSDEHDGEHIHRKPVVSDITPFAQRKTSSADYDDEHIHRKPLVSEITPFVQRSGSGSDHDDEHIHRKPEPAPAAFSHHKSAGTWVDDYDDEHVQLKPIDNHQAPFAHHNTPAASDDYDDEHVQLKRLANRNTPYLQAKSDNAGVVNDSVSGRIKSSMGGGTRMDGETRSFMEDRFGADFGHVKIHNGAESVQLSRALNARAFTVSNNIYFNQGHYQPQTDTGKHLLAHELTHVVQQTGSVQLQRTPSANTLNEKVQAKEISGPVIQKDAEENTAGNLKTPVTAEKKAAAPAGENTETKNAPAVNTKAGNMAAGSTAANVTDEKTTVNTPVSENTPVVEGAAPATDPGSLYKHLDPASTEGVFSAKLHKAGDLAQKTATTKSAAEKIDESKKAEDTPPSESQGKSNEEQVSQLNNREVTPKTKDDARTALDTAIAATVPTKLDDIDKFKKSGKGQEISKAVSARVSNDVADVKNNFNGIGKPAAPAPAEKGIELPAPEEAAKVAPINMGSGVVPEIAKTELETTQYTDQSDDLLKKEEISQEQLEMVDKGDLANANTERKKLQQEVLSQPVEVQEAAAQEHGKLDASMKAEETSSRTNMHQHRTQHLSKAAEKQLKAKQDLELERDKVAQKINDKYKACQDSIMGKLNDLEKNSLAKFDKGQAQATQEFEFQVNYDIDRFKDDRYDRIGGTFYWLKDKLVGIDDFPEVKAAFERARKNFVDKIDGLIGEITKANNEVIAACKKELEDTKNEIATYVASLKPSLQDVGKKAEEEVNQKLKELSAEIDKQKEKLQQQLKDKRKAAMEAIDKKIEAMKESMSGAISVIGKLLLNAALKFFKWALEAAGLSPDDIMGVINKGVAVIKTIVAKPMAFVRNLINAAKTGFKNFGKNFITHLKDAVFNWLTGAMEGVQLPKVWDVKGIFSLVLDILGVSYKFIRIKLVNLMGEPAVSNLEKVFTLVKTLVTEGPIAAWEQLKDMAEEMKETFIDEIKTWIRNTIIFRAIEAIVAMFIPGAGIVKSIIGIYDTVMFFIQKAKDIASMVANFVNSIAEIAAGNIDAAASALEGGLASALTLVINFLARFLHLNGITDKIKKVIEKIRSKVGKVMDKIVAWIQKTAGKLLKKGKDAISSVKGWLMGLLKIEKNFDAEDGTSHRLFFVPNGDDVILMLNPSPKVAFSTWINSIDVDESSPKHKNKLKALAIAKKIDDERAEKLPKGLTGDKKEEWEKVHEREIRSLIDDLSKQTGPLFAGQKPKCAFFEGTKNGEKLAFGGIKNGYGLKMEANFLTNISMPSGSEPSDSLSGTFYDVINKRRRGSDKTNYYVKGHLLNEHLGGTGKDWINLVPLTRKANSTHLKLAERNVKNAVESGNIVHYKVEAKYDTHPDPKPKNKNKTIENIIEGEKKIPTQLVVEASMVTLDTKNQILKSTPIVPAGTVIPNDITDPPEYVT